MNVFQSLVVNVLLSASTTILVGVGLGLTRRVAGYLNFAYAGVFTVGAYSVLFLFGHLGLSLALSVIIATIFCAFLGCVIEFLVINPLKRRSAGPLALLIASMGIYIILQNVLAAFAGSGTQSVRATLPVSFFACLGTKITTTQALIILVSAVVLIATAMFLRFTQVGLCLRAIANDRILARSSGVLDIHMMFMVAAISSGLACIAGILVALDVDMTPTMGMNTLLYGLVAVIVGGVNKMNGIVLGSLLLCLVQQWSAWRFGSQYQDMAAFALLIAALVLRPQGLLGGPLTKTRSASASVPC